MCLVRKQISQLPMSPLFWRLYELSTHFLSQTFLSGKNIFPLWECGPLRRDSDNNGCWGPTDAVRPTGTIFTQQLENLIPPTAAAPGHKKIQMAISWLVIFGAVSICLFFGNISEMKRAIRAPLMAKQPDFQCCFSFYNEARRCNGILTFVTFSLIFWKIIVLQHRSLGALRAPTSRLRPFGPAWHRPLRPSGAQAVWPTHQCNDGIVR